MELEVRLALSVAAFAGSASEMGILNYLRVGCLQVEIVEVSLI